MASDDVTDGSSPFRTADSQTTLFEKPDPASTVLAQLPSGALVTVRGREGDFLRILTSDDKLGYIPGSASMIPFEMPPIPVEMPSAATSAPPQGLKPTFLRTLRGAVGLILGWLGHNAYKRRRIG